MFLYTNNITPRLEYISDFLGKELLGEAFVLIADKERFSRETMPGVNYSKERIKENEFRVEPYSLLFENDIRPQQVDCFKNSRYKYFFQPGGDFPFDIFAASFYLLSRYEEYLPHEKDMYGRYAHKNSLAFREEFLHLPLINIWIQDFRQKLQYKFPGYPFSFPEQKGPFLPTYDIDQAYSYKDKPFWKNANGFIRSLLKGNIGSVKERWNVLNGKTKDPFDTYQWMDNLHGRYKLKPFYFFIVAEKPGKYDKNISPAIKSMKELILQHSQKYLAGVHPSWQSGDDISLLEKEVNILQTITGNKINDSRQHYIRFVLPETFRHLIKAGIKNDFSMGYGSINGFRASVASAFYWFDLEKNEPTDLLLRPFCYMDANSFYEQHYLPEQAYEEMMQYYKVVKSVNGTMITIWHNNFLGTDNLYKGWKEAYEKFIAEISS